MLILYREFEIDSSILLNDLNPLLPTGRYIGPRCQTRNAEKRKKHFKWDKPQGMVAGFITFRYRISIRLSKCLVVYRKKCCRRAMKKSVLAETHGVGTRLILDGAVVVGGRPD